MGIEEGLAEGELTAHKKTLLVCYLKVCLLRL